MYSERLRILFVNHTGVAGGAEHALMRLVDGLGSEHSIAVACPAEGELAHMVDSAGVERYSIPAFEASLRLHPLYTPAGLARLAAGNVVLQRVVRRFKPDIVHANTPRAGLIAVLPRRLDGAPLVVRAHEALPLTGVGLLVRSVLARNASVVATVSRNIAERFDQGLDKPLAACVYNSFDRRRFDPERVRPAAIREELGLDGDAVLLGQVAQITPWKGQETAIRAVAQLRYGGLDAHLLLVGKVAFDGKAVRYDNHAYLRRLRLLVEELGVEDGVHFLGQRRDVPELLRAFDLSLLPSWDEPFANVMLESMAMGTPLLISEVGGAPELVEDGVSGRLLPPRRPDVWAAAARALLLDRPALERMGDRAREATARFGDEAHARDMLALYERALGRTVGPAPRAPDVARRAETVDSVG